MSDVVTHDRGLGSAYERYHFYKLVERWAHEYGVEGLLEGPRDGMAGVPGVHGVGLARAGRSVLSVVGSEEQAAATRAVYASAGAERYEVRVAPGPLEADDYAAVRALPPHDMVIAYHALEGDRWRDYLRAVAPLARKLLVVTTCNPLNWGVSVVRAAGFMRGVRGLEPPESWKMSVLGPELWKVGRVRDHVYFDAPWWPDLFVSPGQSLTDRAKRLWTAGQEDVGFAGPAKDATLARRFVYGADRWPYFGGPGWSDELGPALQRHPSFEGRPGRLGAVTAHLHAFVVDVRARETQARRKGLQVHRSP